MPGKTRSGGKLPARIKTIGIIANCDKEHAVEYSSRLSEWLEKRGVKVLFDEEIAAKMGLSSGVARAGIARRADIVVVFGGDGTLLTAARAVSGYEVPLVGVNLGGFGFMTVINLGGMIRAMEEILRGEFTVSRRMMLEASKGRVIHRALNDVVITRSSLTKMVTLEASVNGANLTTYKADGLIISTPTGSTAYSLSAGGPIVMPEHYSIIISPLCPHTLTMRPIILPPDVTIDVTVVSPARGITASIDGQEVFSLMAGDTIRVRKSDRDIRLVNSPSHDYWDILRTKLGWGQLP
ncbi:MAG: NAD(+)/NADH kinase [Deltaproteobacteria bacterium]|nr:NAD(+)/NADH kinase [Deltaproteobacteria bacterium]